MRLDLVLCGLGGQGVILAGRLLGQMALRRGFSIIAAETHGMAQRGGSVVAHLRLGGARSSLVPAGSADLLIAFKEAEAYRWLYLVKPEGRIILNAAGFPWPEAAGYVKRQKIKGQALDADGLAVENNLLKTENLILLGFACQAGWLPFSLVELKTAIKTLAAGRFMERSLKAAALGAEEKLK